MTYAAYYFSPLGRIVLMSDGTALTELDFAEGVPKASAVHTQKDLPVFGEVCRWLDVYFAGRDPGALPPLAPHGTAFQQAVWNILRGIPYGTTTTYGGIAARIAAEVVEGTAWQERQFHPRRRVGQDPGRGDSGAVAQLRDLRGLHRDGVGATLASELDRPVAGQDHSPAVEPVHHEPAHEARGQFREFRVGGVAGDPRLPFPVDPPCTEFARGGRQFEGDRAVTPGPGAPHTVERTDRCQGFHVTTSRIRSRFAETRRLQSREARLSGSAARRISEAATARRS